MKKKVLINNSFLPLHKKTFAIRTLILFYIVVMAFSCLIIRLAYIKITMNDEYYLKALELWTRTAPVEGARGNIYDRNGKLIVGSILRPTLICIPSQIKDKDYTSEQLSEILQCNKKDVLKHLSKNVSVEIIKPVGRKISLEQAKEVASKKLKGIYIVADTIRYYPYGSLLSHVIGIVGIDNQGLSGIEYQYDEYLKGKRGGINVFTDAHGINIGDLTSFYEEPTKGNDLYLTIDLDIQLSLERVITNSSFRYNPEEISGIVMDPNNSEILAMASYPTFFPNNYQDYPEEIYNRNLPIWSNYEPGSVFKIVTYSAGLEENKFSLDETFYDPGYRIVSGVRIKDWKSGGHGRQTFLEVIQNSCNPGFIEIGERLGVDLLFDYIHNYGFGSKTNIDILGESSGIIFKKDKVGPVELATSSFGQGNSVTMLQMINATSASINGGILNTPYIVSKIANKDITIYEGKKKEVHRVISEETSRKMRFALECVASLGTARSGYIPDYRVGGKTGTAQVVANGIYAPGKYILSFVGALPMNDPKVICMMAIKNAQNTIQYGGVVVAPLVKEVLIDSISILNINKQDGGITKSKQYWYDLPNIKVDNFIGMEISNLPKFGQYSFHIIGTGNTVLMQIPEEGEEIIQGGYVLIYT